MKNITGIPLTSALGILPRHSLPQFLQTLEGDYHVILQRIVGKIGD